MFFIRHAIILIGLCCLSGCATGPLSEGVLGPLPIAVDVSGDDVAKVTFSANKQYESHDGVPIQGDPLVCTRAGIFRINAANETKNNIVVKVGAEISVAAVVQLNDGQWSKSCIAMVAFTPAPNANYVVVSERVGGKGISALWTGIARQACRTTVYRETLTGIVVVSTMHTTPRICQS